MLSFSLMLSHYKFKQIKVKTKFFNGYPASVYQRSEVIESLHLVCLVVAIGLQVYTKKKIVFPRVFE